MESTMPLKKRKRGLTNAEYVRAARAKLGLSQEAFAKKLGYGQGTIAHLENGRIQRIHPLVRQEIERLVREAHRLKQLRGEA